ncbi:MAG: hypothetical protein AAF638_13475, partial [Pseudomonadota bacterium]
MCISGGWTDADRLNWYDTSQGSRLIPERWANALITEDGTRGFFRSGTFDTHGYVRARAGDALPVGFVRDLDPTTGNYWIGLNCSACHTANLNINGQSVRIDGGAGFGDLQSMLERLDALVGKTLADDDAFDSF